MSEFEPHFTGEIEHLSFSIVRAATKVGLHEELYNLMEAFATKQAEETEITLSNESPLLVSKIGAYAVDGELTTAITATYHGSNLLTPVMTKINDARIGHKGETLWMPYRTTEDRAALPLVIAGVVPKSMLNYVNNPPGNGEQRAFDRLVIPSPPYISGLINSLARLELLEDHTPPLTTTPEN